MKTNFEYYKVFYFCARSGNLTSAAKALFLTQPTVTKTIQNLEYTKLITLRVLVGNFGREEPDYKYWFTISVHKKDQERAEYWVRRTV